MPVENSGDRTQYPHVAVTPLGPVATDSFREPLVGPAGHGWGCLVWHGVDVVSSELIGCIDKSENISLA